MKSLNIKPQQIVLYITGIFFFSVIIRFFIANYYPKTINCYPDELLYLSLGESLWNHHNIQVFNVASYYNQVGYPFLIAPSFFFSSVKSQGTVIAFLNALSVSLGIFPVYGLAKRLLTENKHILYCVILYSLSPSLTYSMTYMSESLSIPLSLLCIYLLYRFWETETSYKKIFFFVVSILTMYLCYITKLVALAFPIALAMVILTNWILDKDIKKRILSILICITFLLIGIQIGFKRYFPADILDKSSYVLFCFLFLLVVFVLGFCVIPVLLPAVHFREIDQNSKKLYLFMIYTLVITAVVVACLINPREDYPSLTPRAHLRYVEFLFVPLVILLFQILEKNITVLSRKMFLIIFGVWGVIFLTIFRGFSGQTIDQTMLFYWQLFARDGKYFSPFIVKIICAGIITVITIIIILYFKNRMLFFRMLATGLIIMCVGNSMLSIFVQYKTHTHTAAETTEMEQLREFVRQHPDENFLVLEPDSYCEIIDTFLIDCDNVRTGMSLAVTQRADVFESPSKISYAIVCDTEYEVSETATHLKAYPNIGYSLYVIYDDCILKE